MQLQENEKLRAEMCVITGDVSASEGKHKANPCFTGKTRYELLPTLMPRIAAGDETAFNQFYQIMLGQAHNLVRRLVDHVEGVDDVLEEAFWQAWRDADKYAEARGSVQAWFLNICRSRALDYLRRQDRAVSHADPYAVLTQQGQQQALPTQEDTSLDLLIALQAGSLVQRAVAQLATQERQLIALAFFKDLTYQEIANVCQMPLGSVKTSLRRAFTQLRAMLTQPDHSKQYE